MVDHRLLEKDPDREDHDDVDRMRLGPGVIAPTGPPFYIPHPSRKRHHVAFEIVRETLAGDSHRIDGRDQCVLRILGKRGKVFVGLGESPVEDLPVMDCHGAPGSVETPFPVGKIPGRHPFVEKSRQPLDEKMVDPGPPPPLLEVVDPLQERQGRSRPGNEFQRRVRPGSARKLLSNDLTAGPPEFFQGDILGVGRFFSADSESMNSSDFGREILAQSKESRPTLHDQGIGRGRRVPLMNEVQQDKVDQFSGLPPDAEPCFLSQPRIPLDKNGLEIVCSQASAVEQIFPVRNRKDLPAPEQLGRLADGLEKGEFLQFVEGVVMDEIRHPVDEGEGFSRQLHMGAQADALSVGHP